MPRIEFTPQLGRHVECAALHADVTSLRPLLEAAFAAYPKLRGYLVDDQGAIRQHVAIFVDNKLLRNRQTWDIPLQPQSEVYVMQALSGG